MDLLNLSAKEISFLNALRNLSGSDLLCHHCDKNNCLNRSKLNSVSVEEITRYMVNRYTKYQVRGILSSLLKKGLLVTYPSFSDDGHTIGYSNITYDIFSKAYGISISDECDKNLIAIASS